MRSTGSRRAVNGHRSEVSIGHCTCHGNVLALGGELSLSMLDSGGLVAVVVAGHAGVSELARAAELKGLGIGRDRLAHAVLTGQLLAIHRQLGARRAHSGVGNSDECCKAEHVCRGCMLRCAEPTLKSL